MAVPKSPSCQAMLDEVIRMKFQQAEIEYGSTMHGFDSGYFVAHAEKLAIGACLCSIIPSVHRPCRSVMLPVMGIYGLADDVYLDATGGAEFFLFLRSKSAQVLPQIERLRAMIGTSEENSPTWHAIRGKLCGVPPTELDFAYHDRDKKPSVSSASS